MRRELCARRPNLKSQSVISSACALLRSIEKENRKENVQRCAGRPGRARGLRRRKVLQDRCSASLAGRGRNIFFARWKRVRSRWICAWAFYSPELELWAGAIMRQRLLYRL